MRNEDFDRGIEVELGGVHFRAEDEFACPICLILGESGVMLFNRRRGFNMCSSCKGQTVVDPRNITRDNPLWCPACKHKSVVFNADEGALVCLECGERR